MESITIPKSVTYIGDDIFYFCSALNEVLVYEGSYAANFFLGTEYEEYLSYVPSWLSN